jgi:hypothetical protein
MTPGSPIAPGSRYKRQGPWLRRATAACLASWDADPSGTVRSYPIESRFPCDCREGWSAVRATLLIVGDDVTGRAPVPSELLSAGRLGGHRGRARDRSPHAESQRRVTPKGLRPVAGDVAHDVASCPADAQEQCSSADRGAPGIVLACQDTAGQD